MTPVQFLKSQLRRADRVTVLTGAGVSAASGVPTFRGEKGLWQSVPVEQLASARGFAANPTRVWEWYAWRRELIARAEPNAAHTTLAAWSRDRPGVTIITQNVDGLHERAGTTRLLRLHGSIWHLQCWAPCDEGRAPWPNHQVPLSPLPPRCPHCDGLARPAIVWFGEPLDRAVLADAMDACRCDVFLSIGTSSVVYPAASLVHEAQRHGAWTAEINPEATEASAVVDLAVAAPAEVVLPQLD